MELVSGESLISSRVYLTIFDRVTYSQVAWSDEDVDAIRQNLERQLKFLILIKGHVVIAASHLLESELAHEILLSHPRLFSEGIVVPALRSEFQTFTQFLDARLAEGKEPPKSSRSEICDIAAMLDATVASAVLWQVDQASQWFQQRLIADLRDEQSLLYSYLRERRVIVPPSVAEQIAEIPRLNRNDVYQISKQTQDKQLWDILSNYADFVYYLSGAKAVESEGVLPQENLMDFGLSDLAGGKTHLSDIEVFFKMFVDIVKTATHTHFPVDVLDALNMEDALDLHHVAVNDQFIEKYTLIQEKTKEGLTLHDPERLVMLMEELEQYEIDLHSEYQRAIEAELPGYGRGRKAATGGKLLSAVASLIIPYWGAPGSARDIVVSGLELGNQKRLSQNISRRMVGYANACKKVVDRRDIGSRPILLKFVEEISQRYAKKLPRAR